MLLQRGPFTPRGPGPPPTDQLSGEPPVLRWCAGRILQQLTILVHCQRSTPYETAIYDMQSPAYTTPILPLIWMACLGYPAAKISANRNMRPICRISQHHTWADVSSSSVHSSHTPRIGCGAPCLAGDGSTSQMPGCCNVMAWGLCLLYQLKCPSSVPGLHPAKAFWWPSRKQLRDVWRIPAWLTSWMPSCSHLFPPWHST